MSKQQEIPDEAVEAAANAWMDRASRPGSWTLEDSCRAALEAAAPYILAGVTSLADAWEARGEHDMKVAKTIKDEYIATEILGHGAQMVENARHVRNAIAGKS